MSEERRKTNIDMASMEPAARVKLLATSGAQVEVDFNVPPRRYFRSGLEMVRMANVYLAEGNLESAYVLYMKFMTLFVEKIRSHPEYGTVPAQVKSVNQAKLKEVMPKAEKLKQKLLDQYLKEHEQYKINEEKRRQLEKDRKKQELDDTKLAQTLQAEEDRKGKLPHLTHTCVADAPRDVTHIEATPTNQDEWALTPSAPPVDGVLYPDDFAAEPPRAPAHHYTPSPPLIPPKTRELRDADDTSYSDSLPPLSAGSKLRTVVVPASIQSKFLKVAAAHTERGIECCGILAGRLERNQLKITHVIVPKQTGTADSCSTNNEEEIFHYQDQHNLITLGWIHTHPTQTAFLSSVDLHTQCSYQLMMPEAVAIVLAPKFGTVGYFALTPAHGMSYISRCRLTGFHPHQEDPPLFYEVKHISLNETASVEIVDLRR